MVSEFLGELTLNVGVILWTHHTHDLCTSPSVWDDSSLSFALNPQSQEPTFPTVVPALDFDPNRDAARIDTAIKTKGRILYIMFLIRNRVQSCCNFPLQMSSWYLWVSIPARCFDQRWERLQVWASVLATVPSLSPLCVRQKNVFCRYWCSFPNEAEGNSLLPKPSYLCLSRKQTLT